MFVWSVLLVAGSVACVYGSGAHLNAPINIKETSVSYVPKRCLLDSAPGLCQDYRRNYFFNVKSGTCQQFIYGGCGGNWNRFNSLSSCHRTCTCATPQETGPCRGHFRRWFYSPADGCCRPFVYGGCGGNSNNYATWLECSNSCGFPTAGSNWWKWGAEWGKWNAGQTNQSSSFNSSRWSRHNFTKTYSKQDFMRDWTLWGLLLGEEGGAEMEIEELALLISKARRLGIGKRTGPAVRVTGDKQSGLSTKSQFSAQGSGNFNTGGSASTGFYGDQQTWQNGRNKWGLGGATGGMANWGPTYKIGKPGSFTPLGEVGSIANLIDTRMTTGSSRDSSQFSSNQQSSNQGSSNQHNKARGGSGWQGVWGRGGGRQGSNWALSRGNIGNRQGTGSVQGFGMEGGWSSGARGSGGRQGNANAHGTWRQDSWTSGRRNVGNRQGSGNMQSAVSGRRWSFGANKNTPNNRLGGVNVQGGWGQNRWTSGGGNSGNMPRGSAAKGGGKQDSWISGSGTFGLQVPAIEILRLMAKLGSGGLKRTDFMGLANTFNAVSPNGTVDIDILAQGLIGSLQGPSGANLAQLKGIAQSFGALDGNGNIDTNMFIKGLTRSFSGGQLGGPSGAGNVPGGSTAKAGWKQGSWVSGKATFGLKVPALEILRLIAKLGSGGLKRTDFMGLANTFNAVSPNGKVNVDILAQGLVNSLQGPSGANLAQLKGVAQSLGAVDGNGNIDTNMFIKGLTRSFTGRGFGGPGDAGKGISGGSAVGAGGTATGAAGASASRANAGGRFGTRGGQGTQTVQVVHVAESRKKGSYGRK